MIKVAGALSGDFQFTAAQALLGAKVQAADRRFPHKLWEILRGQANWEMWKARGKWVHEKSKSAPTEITICIWSQVRQYLIIAWSDYMSEVENNKLTIDKAQSSFKKDFGSIHDLWSVEANILQVQYISI
jgi:hypothetical protein